MSRDRDRPNCYQSNDTRKAWVKPRLEKLGRISDIAGPPVPLFQAASGKFS